MKRLSVVCAILLSGCIVLSVHVIATSSQIPSIIVNETATDAFGRKSIESGWLMPGEVFEFYSEDGSRMVVERDDIEFDPIVGDGESYLEVTESGFTLHVPANL